MKLDITEIMNRRKDRLDFGFDFEFPDSPDGALLPEGVTLAGPAQIDCRVTDVNGFHGARSAEMRMRKMPRGV